MQGLPANWPNSNRLTGGFALLTVFVQQPFGAGTLT
ncbi:hypothetical protein A1122_15965 [Yersinia pestis A1122]|nr:hypothetical protein YPC_2280 [Yersinia pestis biovar Medievalis str. Harbin 35]AEL73814.1 hypothetical protein A1122_15965 [Yersinia pestis A1122]EEO76951.1 hypothetical protein YP516_1683 [Yersinia pestis Nepal516]EEO80883.1 hypothetical protein YPF_2528 [Yersinia pestis biovar Orientalis str. India 195]EEO83839.1 hypothetical protein YPH_4484 [Yersinia pestis biovar Orientalis str. PEXU2]EEO90241.1 hypothetical protein YPS_2528 [Yersinia pestis Pestoides A]EKS46450.1 hypothetical protei